MFRQLDGEQGQGQGQGQGYLLVLAHFYNLRIVQHLILKAFYIKGQV